ncbi:uncharacterized protein I303_103526 [Kwoniella dejecticola CBS 10117]|uniref:Uncharacterized protein n=1 Tax=Kwoniella dejecticola CBS 10117 TaxID=1296121 RepID=A0A1A6A703_9TREE|nr:uncharacterized protein I303_03550 [Kwoniella dejecticola CBS 10117]OBR85836.1 hypothetical protein I303_03550 [Kwoniella dejecticola CBS 10117]
MEETGTRTRLLSGSSSSTATAATASPQDQSVPASPTSQTGEDEDQTLSPGGGEGRTSIPESPSASLFLRTAETLDGLSKQLGHIKDDSEDSLNNGVTVCCCGTTLGNGNGILCRTLREREKVEDKLKLSGEIGHALLQKYEALERKYQREIEKYENQLQVKRNALLESVRKVNNLEKANTQHLQKFAEVSKKNEALEKRYTQAMHTQTLTQQSLTHVRAELTSLRATSQRQKVALASGAGVGERLAEAEKKYEDARDLAENETRKVRDEVRKRKRVEARIEELELQVRTAKKEVEEVKEARSKDAQDLLANAKERLSELHNELSETFHADSPSDMPEYQKTLEDLVAANTLLKHDVSELTHSLSDSRDESRTLKEEVEELRSAIGTMGKASPFGRLPTRLATELGSGHSYHSRTESSPILSLGQGNGYAPNDRGAWQRMSVASSSRTGGMSAWEHHRKMSMAASFTSNTSSTADGALMSPGLGMGPIGEFGGILLNEDGSRTGALSPPQNGRESPKFRTSPSGGIGYVLNGVPKGKPGHQVRPSLARSFSTNTDRRSRRSYASQGVGPIAEWSGNGAGDVSGITEEPLSPGTDYFRAAEKNRKRRSLMLARRSTMSPNEYTDYSPNASNTLVDDLDYPSPMSDSALSNTSPKRAKRKTLLLLTRSQGVQTDSIEQIPHREHDGRSISAREMTSTSTGTSPIPPSEDHSETSSIHDKDAGRAGILLIVIEHMSRMLARLRDADVPTLNKRLKKHNLPGDVAHLSQSTMRALQLEVAELRNQFKGIHNLGGIDRKDFNLLLRLFKDVFSDLVDLQAIVNDVTINPSLSKKLQKAAFREDTDKDPLGPANKGPGGLGWIAAPITKFFVTPAENDNIDHDHSRKGGIERGRLQPSIPVKAAPKQQAVASATTTHVSVEFGGTGIVRRATPAINTANPREAVIDILPPSPLSDDRSQSVDRDMGRDRTISPATLGGDSENSLLPPTIRNVRRSKSRANRNELLGIFAGATRPLTPTGGESWTVLGNGLPGSATATTSASASVPGVGGRTLRSVSSHANIGGSNGDKTIRAKASKERKKISSVVDAMIDPPSSAGHIDTEVILSGSYEPEAPLLERTLRPRGLSDSSIRSTFVSQSIDPIQTGRAPAYTPAQPGAESSGGGGVLQSISRRWYDFRGSNEVTPINPDPVNSDASATGNQGAMTNENDTEIKSPPIKPIPLSSQSTRSSISTTTSSLLRDRAISPSTKNSVITPPSTSSGPTIATSQSGLFGLIASSLVGTSHDLALDSDRARGDEEEDELVGASLRQGGLIGRGHGHGHRGKSWR